ncbi:hypothetical protein SAMN05421821_1168 [Mucilaginibacter lappiensis]|uniref:Uncharacterized protein n=1 Tax=Mucilaginibacter lappiensis TaxID=354630 RepID=A0A1N7EYW2_9SPHI|nr:hypothetical protein [Mucilaginibacter lappiensis]SIR93288.1 hypothetical protein SAMN05421821_1168 [Mucilaginibacter lappiensis]
MPIPFRVFIFRIEGVLFFIQSTGQEEMTEEA